MICVIWWVNPVKEALLFPEASSFKTKFLLFIYYQITIYILVTQAINLILSPLTFSVGVKFFHCVENLRGINHASYPHSSLWRIWKRISLLTSARLSSSFLVKSYFFAWQNTEGVLSGPVLYEMLSHMKYSNIEENNRLAWICILAILLVNI